ncbi:alanine-zipper protein [Ostreibacterium oceani]|uniref:Murein lipoprotein n=1 Tax=Ostreibacterium oceani TaxID=2654998 RepID=A0A6N7EXH0_9GAMM|nr:alanine-zipper protein [Ostreibacterium oceani]MPV85827.1 hypothetical protein [Ostreibacterium oceani]
MKKIVLIMSTAALFATGCSSISQADLDALRADVAAAKESSDRAYQAAQQANLNAQDAKAMAVKTDEKVNRAFSRSQRK